MEVVERKFQIGDKVKITDVSFGSVPLNTLDKQGKVVDVNEFNLILVSFDDPEVTHKSWWYNVSQIELVTNVKIKPKSLGELLKEKLGKTEDTVETPTEEVKKPNSQGGIKFDLGKRDYTILLQDLKVTVDEVTDVLELGAKKYARGNYKLIESDRYHKAMLRHIMSYLSGELNDPETGKHHLAHAICCAAFLIEREVKKED